MMVLLEIAQMAIITGKRIFLSGNYGNDAHKIGIILNLDGVCLVNPLGVRAKTYKYCMIYYTIAEILQEYMSHQIKYLCQTKHLFCRH